MTQTIAVDESGLAPIRSDAPCGDCLDYDPEFLILQHRVMPVADAQYGDFVHKAEAPDWHQIEREARRLLLRSKDITLLALLLRSLTHLHGASGFAEGLALLAAHMIRYPDALHPQLVIEGQIDPQVRANALQALTDPEGLLGDLRQLALSSQLATALSVREVEKALALPRAGDALPREPVLQQLRKLAEMAESPLRYLMLAYASMQVIADCAEQQLGEYAPNLTPLLNLLGLFAAAKTGAASSVGVVDDTVLDGGEKKTADDTESMASLASDRSSKASQLLDQVGERGTNHALGSTEVVLPERAPARADPAAQRLQIQSEIAQLRRWLEQHEPSSPVPMLLLLAEQLIGAPFAAISRGVTPELQALLQRALQETSP